MVKVITVHGTFAHRDSDHGDSWWQVGSPFQKLLQNLIQEPLDVEPFHWSGANSEVQRRKTGARLAKVIGRSEEPPLVIGHSHGGSAAIQALLLLYLQKGKRSCAALRGIATIGTPMFRFRWNRNPFSRFDVMGRLMLLFAIGLLGMKGGDLANQRTPDDLFTGVQLLRQFFVSVEVAFASLILFLLYAYSYRNAKRQDLFRLNTLFGSYSDCYVALNHERDEAINGLRSVKILKPKLIKTHSVFVSLFSFLSLLLVAVFFVAQLLKAAALQFPPLLETVYQGMRSLLITPTEAAIERNVPGANSGGMVQELAEALNVVPILAIVGFSAAISFVIAAIITPNLASFVAQQIKGQSFGDDGFGETIMHVAPGLDFEQEQVGTLPQEVEDEMQEHSLEDATDAIARLRELLSSGELLDREGADLMAQATKFEKSELIHNAYFHSRLFVSYLAAVLVHRFGLNPSDAFHRDNAAMSFLHELEGSASPLEG
ncbi:hypothetical protein [Parvularcula maris]|uniref:Alpha/beta hydrolase n=1 Tax=Parvularcula maris TaxID=2965077 RepID=A0A9X2L728_9PROT|nr:hypothetical protein [Parvularcula maris]MCQ8184134.1 hypothetical protein [Parvularcula maris]